MTVFIKISNVSKEKQEQILAQNNREEDVTLCFGTTDDNGQKQGAWSEFDNETRCKILEENYKDDQRHGPYQKFDAKTGKKTLETNFKDGLKHGLHQEFDPKTGNKIVEKDYIDNKLQGVYKEFDPKTGNKTAEVSFKNNQLHGLYRKFDTDTGNRALEVNCKDGQWHGLYQEFNSKTGALSSIRLYKHNALFADMTARLKKIQFIDNRKAMLGIKKRDIDTLNRDQTNKLLKKHNLVIPKPA